jgi:hypothetical protein
MFFFKFFEAFSSRLLSKVQKRANLRKNKFFKIVVPKFTATKVDSTVYSNNVFMK